MRWEDERYVRFYTRDTAEFLALSWQARGLLGLVMRKVDRAGVLPVGKLGLKGVAVAVGGPWVEIEAPLLELLSDGCVVFDEPLAALLLPNFIEAQEAKASDAARQRASRERARASFGGSADAAEKARTALSVTQRDAMESQGVTNSHTLSHAVTDGHAESHAVTPSLAVPSLPSRAEATTLSASQPTAPKAKKSADPRLKPLEALLVAAYSDLRGEAYAHGGAKDVLALKALLPLADDAAIVARWRVGLESSGWSSCNTLAQLRSKWNDLAAGVAPAGAPKIPDVRKGIVRAEDMAYFHKHGIEKF